MQEVEASDVHAHFLISVIHVYEVGRTRPGGLGSMQVNDKSTIKLRFMLTYGFYQTINIITICTQYLQRGIQRLYIEKLD